MIFKEKEILSIALKCRSQIETYVLNLPEHEYRPSPDELDCMCAITSRFLTYCLNAKGFDAEFVVGKFDKEKWSNPYGGWDHCWVEYRGTIIDLTVRQFDLSFEDIHLAKQDDPMYKAIHRGKSATKHVSRYWPQEQRTTPGLLARICSVQPRNQCEASSIPKPL